MFLIFIADFALKGVDLTFQLLPVRQVKLISADK